MPPKLAASRFFKPRLVQNFPFLFSSPSLPSIPRIPSAPPRSQKMLGCPANAAGHVFDHVIGIRRAVDGFLFSRHDLTCFRAASQTCALQAWLDPEFPSESAPAEPWLSDIHGEAELPGAALKCLPGFWRPARLPGKRFVP